MTVKLPLVLCLVALFSSCDPFALKPINVHTLDNGKIKARWFFTSAITTLHYHVEIDHHGDWIPVLETGDKIDSVSLDRDTVNVHIIHHPSLYVYTAVYWGIYVNLDEEGW